MKVAADMKVRINCPSAKKYPSFHRAFHGRLGRVVADLVTTDFVAIDISRDGESVPFINVDRNWLMRAA